MNFYCELLKKHSKTSARVLKMSTPHGDVITPVFMPVGTKAGVNNMMPSELFEVGSQLILGGNTYHMLCEPGMNIIEEGRGMHAFMGWNGPMLTDSGGFQIFSLSKNKQICSIDEDGAHFRLPHGEHIHMTPALSLEAQKIIGADIIMAFDQCTPDEATEAEAYQIMIRTHRWLRESVAYHEAHPHTRYDLPQALFGIIQGGMYENLRAESAAFIASLNTAGIAIGGETIGFDMAMTEQIIDWVRPYLPEEKPRYTMGVGMSPQDLLTVVAKGIDMFDCVAPTRNARHGALYSGEIVQKDDWLEFESEFENHRLHIKKAQFANDLSPIMATCRCYTCRHHSRAFLHHLFKQKVNLFTALASIHNIYVMQDTCAKMRAFILNNE